MADIQVRKGQHGAKVAEENLPAQRDLVSQGPSHSVQERVEALEALILSQNAIIERILELVNANG